YIFGTLLTASGDLKTLNMMAACGMVLNIGLNLVLIPRWQVLGAATAGLITQIAMALAQMSVAGRRYSMRPGFTQVLAPLAYVAVLAALAGWLRLEGTSLLKAAPLLAGTALLTALFTGLLPVKDIRSALQPPRHP
ncbi:MAG: polysaccharide biosynthesis C-terminal domain-containing protein, partial [Flavobacteriales bacterium]